MILEFTDQVDAALAFVEAKQQIKRWTAVVKAAEPLVKAYFEAHPDASHYERIIGIFSGSRTDIDPAKVKAALGENFFKCQRRISYTYLAPL